MISSIAGIRPTTQANPKIANLIKSIVDEIFSAKEIANFVPMQVMC